MARLQRAFGLATLLLALGGGCSSDEESRREQCERVRNHVVSLRLNDLPAVDEVGEQTREAHRSALTQALGDEFIGACEARYEKREIECALAARDVAAATTCGDR
jgi:hypothetical protein